MHAIGVRVPVDVHERLVDLAAVTGESQNSIMFDAVVWHLSNNQEEYVENMKKKLDRLLTLSGPNDRIDVSEQLENTDSGTQPYQATVLRLPSESEQKLGELSKLVGESQNAIVNEALQRYFEHYMQTDAFIQSAEQKICELRSSLGRIAVASPALAFLIGETFK